MIAPDAVDCKPMLSGTSRHWHCWPGHTHNSRRRAQTLAQLVDYFPWHSVVATGIQNQDRLRVFSGMPFQLRSTRTPVAKTSCAHILEFNGHDLSARNDVEIRAPRALPGVRDIDFRIPPLHQRPTFFPCTVFDLRMAVSRNDTDTADGFVGRVDAVRKRGVLNGITLRQVAGNDAPIVCLDDFLC